jgi:hypothetical protein
MQNNVGYGVFVCFIREGEVSVLLSMRILFKFLIHRFVNRVTVVDVKFIHMYFLFAGYEYVVFVKIVQKLSFSGFLAVLEPDDGHIGPKHVVRKKNCELRVCKSD